MKHNTKIKVQIKVSIIIMFASILGTLNFKYLLPHKIRANNIHTI